MIIVMDELLTSSTSETRKFRSALWLTFICLCLSPVGCSLTGLHSDEAAVGTLFGAGLGAGAGALTAEFDDSLMQTEATALGGAIGAGLGLLAGGFVFDDKVEAAQALPPVREPRYLDLDAAKEIDAKSAEVFDATKYGGGEVREWDDRYLGENPSSPYQGP